MEQGSQTQSVAQEDKNKDILYIFTDLETDNIEGRYLLQIAAVTQDNEQFNQFINPNKILSLATTNFHGLYWYKGDLYRNGAKLNSRQIVDVLKAFMKWIKNFKRPVLLAFHNGFAFDSWVLSNKLVHFDIEVPENLISIGDTLPFFRKTLKQPEIENHRLSTLAKYFSIEESYAHDALSDSITLKLICEKFVEKFKVSLEDIFKDSTRSFNSYILNQRDGTPIPKLIKTKTKITRPVKQKPAE